ncbi:bifunctional glycosyltransferase/CDP-glycerol:glycerophosphate glycerophosphotransferase [Actinomadura opuntiae]|uniref:bifunctional glycosyltransferase/CDP-glycerol:glycerophosphate glycerophosphotransferase n=1 Tax=Actinomadura sp. OS1-43 TaxID=604315 RepID=UPI00255B2C9C|nr:bifunctional glycosyltransferase family 2 protein/CDP-glycerol:glycerophosphate glycerophosphotransferase [Actinomadura sp. OS1-43]MDL4814684.1 bifunctional glycosyltransferase family 2 protein/CDP-glycerol:glycerophosphate glycerophosphotransferase [Actinomadura sp. OS1-43]
MSSEYDISLSIIVPVHKVQGYLRQCLDSLLVPDVPNLEIIAIDDASPDACGEILDEYAERDSRMKVRHLTENVGLGEARNVGLDMATGDYVWFFDSDDYATEGAVKAICDRLGETRPDVLMFDYARSYWNGRVKRSIINHLFREPPAPEVFTLADRPSLLEMFTSIWNRAIRREFMIEHGLRFNSGYYEDVSITYPVLMAAERVSFLDRVCYIYRQRRSGAITKTASDKHFDAFDQYDRIFAFMDHLGPQMDRFRPLMFNRTIWHLLVILERADRVYPSEKPRFFAEMTKTYNRYKPPGHVPPDDEPGLADKHRAIERGDFRAWERLNSPKLAAKAKKGGRKVRKLQKRGVVRSKELAKERYYAMRRHLPIEEDLAVFAAYWYRGYSCNPAAIYEKVRELAPHIRCVWIVKPGARKTMPDGVEYVVAGSAEYYRTIAAAKYFVNNVNFPDNLVKRPGQVHLETQHGTPLKKMGLDQMEYPVGAGDMDFKALIERSDRWDFLVSANPLMSEAWERGFPCKYELLEIGYPRNDRLVRATPQEQARLRDELGIPEGKTAILYAPTHRDYQRRYTPMFDIGRVMEQLGDDHVLLLRAHYYYKVKNMAADLGWPEGRVIDVSKYPSVEDLMIASDALLTDYSSVMFDYANLGRPIVVYANDWETYKLTRGVNFDLTEFPPGVVAYAEAELVDAFASRAAWGDAAAKNLEAFRARFCPWDDGNASERAVRRVFLGERLPPVPPAISAPSAASGGSSAPSGPA